jgi:hypothetical protein
MNLDNLPLCGRARELTRSLRAGRATEAGLLRHVEACPRCRAGLHARRRGRHASQRADYVLAVVRAAGRARLAALLGELARACAARLGPARRRIPTSRRPREAALVLQDAAHLRRRLGVLDGHGLAADWPQSPPEPAAALAAARACLLAAERLDGATELRRLQLATCALLGGDEISAGALCSEIVASAGRGAERAWLARRAGSVARDWGLAPARLLPLLRQPAGAGAN